MKTYLTVRGTAEPHNKKTTMLGQVATQVNGLVDWVDVDYPASIAVFNPQGTPTGVSEAQSRAIGVANLAAEIRRTPNDVILSGYSLGALVVSDLLAAKARGDFSDCFVDAVVNIANPARRPGQSYGRPSFGFGLDGPHAPWPTGLPTFEIANPVDGITSAPANSPWRAFAGAIRKLSVSVQSLDAWFADLIRQLDDFERALIPTQWTDQAFWQAWAEAPAWLRGYLFDGQHTAAYGDAKWYDSSGHAVNGVQLAASVVKLHA
ncbi:alpha/beta fold hydrolase [Gordonia sp. CPCC 205515]|uniref:PE-PPE domain-containing protein n=1 Tax=Gordonia sp. CPCC 205515 TaxID=3140791 RepID=UPI003AF34046